MRLRKGIWMVDADDDVARVEAEEVAQRRARSRRSDSTERGSSIVTVGDARSAVRQRAQLVDLIEQECVGVLCRVADDERCRRRARDVARRAREAGRRERAGRSMRGFVWFLKYLRSMSLMSCCSRRRRISGRLARASVSASSRLTGVASKDGWSVGTSCADHSGESGSLRISCLSLFSAMETLCVASSSADSRFDKLGLDLGAFERRGRAGGDARFGAAEVLAREIEVGDLVLLVAQREDQIPVGALHLRDDLDGAAAEIGVRLFEPLALDAYLRRLRSIERSRQSGCVKVTPRLAE